MNIRELSAQNITDMRPYGGWPIIMADPPWQAIGNTKENPGKGPLRHYDTMKTADICNVPVSKLAANDALLLLWVTAPYAEIAFSVINAWGFSYRSQLCWPKNKIGTGHWARNQHELLYICRRGKFPCDKPALFPKSLIPGRVREHSRKPYWPAEIVEARFPGEAKLELFAREARPGWSVIGNQVGVFDADPLAACEMEIPDGQ
jgi:N6-adenosine-specific RNA methylase IME4